MVALRLSSEGVKQAIDELNHGITEDLKEKIKNTYKFGTFLELKLKRVPRELVYWLYGISEPEPGHILMKPRKGVQFRLYLRSVQEILNVKHEGTIEGMQPPDFNQMEMFREFNNVRAILDKNKGDFVPKTRKKTTAQPDESQAQPVEEEGEDDEEGDAEEGGDHATTRGSEGDDEGDAEEEGDRAARRGSEGDEEGDGGDDATRRGKKKAQKDKPPSISMELVHYVLKNTTDIDLKLRLFFMIVIQKYLMPGASSTLNEYAVMHTRNLDLISKIDWGTVVYEYLREGVKKWNKGEKTIHGCCMVPVVFFLEHVEHDITNSKSKTIPRINQYTPAEVKTLIKWCKQKSSQGGYGGAEFRRTTFYGSLLPSADTRELGQEGLALLAQAQVFVPPNTQLDNEITQVLGGGQNWKSWTKLHRENLYIHHVMNKIDSQEQQSILHFNDVHEVSQADFVKSFRPTGEMDRSLLRIQFSLWNAEWKAQKKPYFIVPEADPIILDLVEEQLNGNITGMKLIFVPIEDLTNSWYLLVVDIDKGCGHLLNPMVGNSVTADAEEMMETVCNCLPQDTSTWGLIVKRGISQVEDKHDSGICVMRFIEGFESNDLFKYDKEMLLTCRKTYAVDLIYHDANKLCPPRKLPPSATEVALTTFDDPTTVVEPTTVDQVLTPTMVDDPTTATVYTDDSTMDDDAVQTDDDGNSRKRGADNSMFEGSIPPAKRPSRQRPVAITAVRHTKLPTPHSKLYQSICLDNTYAEEEVVHIEHGEGEVLSIKGVDMAKFISGGVLTFNILQAFIEFLKHDEGMGAKKRIFMPPQDYATLNQDGVDIVVPTVWTDYETILLPVRHGDLWIIYVCHNGATGSTIPNFMSLRENENDPSARKAQRKFIIEALGKALRRRNRSSPFDHRDVKRITYREEFNQWLGDNIAHRVGLLSMYFLENFSGTDFNPSVESLDKYNISVLEYIIFHPKNTKAADFKKKYGMDGSLE